MTKELEAIIRENLAELERVYSPSPGKKLSEYTNGYQEGYKLACSHLLAVLEHKTGSLLHPHILLGQRAGYSDEPSRGR